MMGTCTCQPAVVISGAAGGDVHAAQTPRQCLGRHRCGSRLRRPQGEQHGLAGVERPLDALGGRALAELDHGAQHVRESTCLGGLWCKASWTNSGSMPSSALASGTSDCTSFSNAADGA